MNIVNDIEDQIVNTLQDGGINALRENSLDIVYEVQNALSKQGLACIVAVTSLDHQGNNHDKLKYDANVEIQILENPIINRARLKKQGLITGTAMDLALQAAEAIGNPTSYNFPRFVVDSIA